MVRGKPKQSEVLRIIESCPGGVAHLWNVDMRKSERCSGQNLKGGRETRNREVKPKRRQRLKQPSKTSRSGPLPRET